MRENDVFILLVFFLFWEDERFFFNLDLKKRDYDTLSRLFFSSHLPYRIKTNKQTNKQTNKHRFVERTGT